MVSRFSGAVSCRPAAKPVLVQSFLGGQTYKGRSFLSSDEYAALKEGEPIELIYLPGQARTAAPVFVVEASRKAAAEIAARKRQT